VKKKIVYEQPINERIRSLLRLEHLFAGIMYRLKGPAEWDSRAVIDSLIEVLDLLCRIDLRVELQKDLEYHAQILERWQRTPDVDTERLAKLLNKTRTLLCRLGEIDRPVGDSLSQHQLINLVRQRGTISGGTCRCDLPGYHHWLQKNPKQRQSQLSDWLAPLLPVRDAINLDLYLIRNNAVVSQETATAGFFQSKLDANAQYRIIQVILPMEHPCYPEINGGKQRFTIRFFEPQPHLEERPKPTEQNVNFELCCCMI
jgi:cell division protein ZapD